MLELRRMESRDLEEVAAIEEEIFSMPWSVQGFADSLKLADTLYITALREGQIVGYCGLFQSFEEAEITNVAVRKSCQSQGIGSRMLTELIRLGGSRGVKRCILEVRKSNEPARKLYTKLGFQEIGMRKNFYEQPVEDAVIMECFPAFPTVHR